ncbi:ComF family protein [Ornithinibacillus bavariensis]|uniref:Amidophosphoribosyltransferase n=1 Tax=Ornithinibacillus bavariensis TaxID=545502 RepID=A0A919X8M9_9BACI|nr:ComF family protein [Ornithinibacillus bavariensis]GIO26437.1 amidophosphoribosyltransferase [Ornithinibacillus bavariensis]
MNCLWCHEAIILDVNWLNILIPSVPRNLCDTCASNLEKINGKRCRKCSRIANIEVCEDCTKWEKYYQGYDVLEFNYSIFQYNEHIKKIIAKWKYRGDYELGNIFNETFKQEFVKKFSHLKNAVVVPIPLSRERLEERCFNQAEMLADFLQIPKVDILTRVHGEKQSKKTRQERIISKNPFSIQQNLNKYAILVDDIYTTGTTLRHAAKLLQMNGCPRVFSYTLVRG